MAEPNLRQLDTVAIAARCATETLGFVRGGPHDDAYCIELIRRAVVEQSVEARLAASETYAPIVRGWVSRVAPEMDARDIAFLASEETDHFWRNYTADKFRAAEPLRQALGYWEVCVRRAALKHWLKRARETPLEVLEEIHEVASTDPAVDDVVNERLLRQRFWEVVLAHCQDETDRALARFTMLSRAPRPELSTSFQRSIRTFPNRACPKRVSDR